MDRNGGSILHPNGSGSHAASNPHYSTAGAAAAGNGTGNGANGAGAAAGNGAAAGGSNGNSSSGTAMVLPQDMGVMATTLLICQGCRNTYSEPYLLNCFHSLCANCVHKNSGNSIVMCPVCS